MTSIEVAYKPIGSSAPAVRRLRRSLPAQWRDMPPDQVWACIEMLFQGVPRRRIVDYLLQLPVFIEDRISRDEMYDLLQCIDWMIFDYKSCAPVAPYIDSKDGGRLHLPSDHFANVTCLEYVLLDEKYEEYLQAPSEDIAAELIAIILRPPGHTADPAADARTPLLSKEQKDAWVSQVRSLPLSARAYMMYLISANRQYVFDTYGHWLFKEPAGAASGDDSSPASGLNMGWWGTYLDVAEDGIFGTYEQVLHSAFHDVCAHMIRKVQAARERQQAVDHAALRAGLH